MFKLGLLTAAGYLVPKNGLSQVASGGLPVSPPTTPFVEMMPVPPIKETLDGLDPPPKVMPQAGEGRTRPHQALEMFPPVRFAEVHQREALHSFHPELPMQTIWGFDGMFPGPTHVCRYGEPYLVRNHNDLPEDNGGFGLPSVSTHLHNSHTPSESDGFPCDFFEHGQFYDQHYPNVLAGFSKQFPPNGDPREAMSTLWYHDHRVDFTAQNVYKGLAGFCLLFNEHDTGDESTGFRLPSGEYDVPMLFADKVFDPEGLAFFDLFNLDGIIGDKLTVNGKIQPFFPVHPRKYRLRLLNTGPSRFMQLALSDTRRPQQILPLMQISNDGNLLPRPVEVESIHLSVAERVDVIVDFSESAGRSFVLLNRMEQINGRAPTSRIMPVGASDAVMRFDVVLPPVADSPPLPEHFYDLPPTNANSPEVVARRLFRLDRLQGQWTVNGRIFDCETALVTPREGTAEIWTIQNTSNAWQHPVHIHFEEHQILTRNGQRPSVVERARKDVTRLGFGETIELFIRFRDFLGRYPAHCHNVVHEDHAMMMRFDIVP